MLALLKKIIVACTPENDHCCLHSSGFLVLLVSLGLRPLTKKTVSQYEMIKVTKRNEKFSNGCFGHLMEGGGSVERLLPAGRGTIVLAKGAEGATGFLGLKERNWLVS